MQSWNQISRSNSLIMDGKPPFHLSMRYQLFDMSGQPAAEGTLEEWWTRDKGFRLEIKSPLETTVGPGKLDLRNEDARREHYLVMQMLHTIVFPMARMREGQHYFIYTQERDAGTETLTCYHYETTKKPPRLTSSFVCVDPATGMIQDVPSELQDVERSHPRDFGDEKVPSEVSISYSKLRAISGRVTLLEPLDLSKTAVELKNPDAPASGGSPGEVSPAAKTIPAGPAPKTAGTPGKLDVDPKRFSGGELIKREPLKYPTEAARKHLYGKVLLHFKVSEDGKTSEWYPIASPSPLLTAASIDSVKRWVYRPYLRNGVPESRDLVLKFSFNLGSEDDEAPCDIDSCP